MNRSVLVVATAALLSVPVLAQARGHVDVGIGVGIGVPSYYGPSYYGGSPYYYPYGPSYYYAPPAYYVAPRPPVTYVEPEPQEQVSQPASWYFCPESKGYYPYVKECAGGWQEVSARGTAPPPPPRRAQVSSAPVAGKVVYRFGDLLFAPGRAELQPAADATLHSLLATMRHETFRHVTIEGHTDTSGNEGANRELSQRRAEAVRQYLIGQGIPGDKITAVGKGETDPIANNGTADGRQLNRRVDVIVS